VRGRYSFAVICLAIFGACDAAATDLQPATLAAFEKYVATTEKRLENEVRQNKGAIWLDSRPGLRERVRAGEILVQPAKGNGETSVPSGLIHDWMGAMFIPGATLRDTFEIIHDYDDYKQLYKPGVVDSKLLSQEGNDYDFYLRLRRKDIMTVVMNTRYKSECLPIDGSRWFSRTYSTHVAEVEDPGGPGEAELPVGTGHGFLWRLNSFTRFEERDGGVYIELESVALTRNVPFLLGWIIQPVITRVARESMATALNSTRAAVLKETEAAAVRRAALREPQPEPQP
jgi:hypothetical protein